MMTIKILALALLMGAPIVGAQEATKTKESYTQKAEAEVQEWTAKLKSLQERSEKSGAKTRQELDKRLKVVEDGLNTARKNLDGMRASNEMTWKSFRKNLEEALSDVKHALRNAQAFFNKSEKKAREGS